MSRNTMKDLRNTFIYQVYSRNHNESGTFKEFISDLDRIKKEYWKVFFFQKKGRLKRRPIKYNILVSYFNEEESFFAFSLNFFCKFNQ